jgi:hypothetical protein
MHEVKLNIPGLYAAAIAAHFIIVMKNYISGRLEAEISPEMTALLGNLEKAFQKLDALSERVDDETPQPVSFTIPEAEAFIKAFTEEELKHAALKDEFYQRHSYAAWFARIYAGSLKEIGAGYVEALAA